MAIANRNFSPPLIIYFGFLILFSCPTAWSSIQDGEALLQFKKALGDPDALRSWVPNVSPCQDKNNRWENVLCYDSNVMGIRLHRLGISGRIDVEALSKLPSLRSISLEGNKFSGPIPEFNRLGALKALYLSDNQFSGPIPSDYFSKLEALKKLWLNNNQFTGDIPSSLAQLKYLQELHLENNKFTGNIPPLKQPPLLDLNLSNNQLQGEIPSTLSMFNSSSFSGNPGLCGSAVGNDCGTRGGGSKTSETPPTDKTGSGDQATSKSNTVVIAVGLTISAVVLTLLIIVIIMKKRRHVEVEIPTATPTSSSSRSSTPHGSKKKSINEGVVEVQMNSPTLSRKDSNSSTASSRKSTASRKSSTKRDSGGSIGDITMVNDSKGSFGMADLMRASAEVLGNGGMGSAYKAVMANGVAVAVKRMRELNKLEKDAFDAEMRKLSSLRHTNVLPPLAYHYRKEEKLVVYEYVAKGSLHFLLHGDRGASHAELTWPTRLKMIKGVTLGLQHLHSQLKSHDLPHGNLKSSNILINLQNEPLLSDYGFNIMTNPNVAPNALFAYKSPEAMQNQEVSPKCDIYCLGVVILEILTGKFPSQYLSNTKGGTDVVQWVVSAIGEGRESGLLDPEMVSKSPNAKDNMVQLLHVGAECTDPDPNKRPGLMEVIEKIKSLEVEGGGNGDQIGATA
ncbi:hypothetical protein Cgig2_006967 [Carnegiea gigantea]|uniref:Protein kinase domain-containing protein n=1 Tax=Carnegiea gigantea TaxID=171969 RepID=A0A9Q1KE22_9CARY|nr:hypothetical protein Cgig2_006967 [Carnegiea gigantea]